MLSAKIKKEFGANGRVAFALDCSFVVRQGITVLFGPSGSGKTTILRSIAGIVEPDEGRIELGEQVYFDSAKGINVPIQRRRIGFVFQEYLVFPHLTAVQNVAYAIRSATLKGRHDRALELLDMLGIAYASDRRPHQEEHGQAVGFRHRTGDLHEGEDHEPDGGGDPPILPPELNGHRD